MKMPPLSRAAEPSSSAAGSTNYPWVPVTWMPHTSLSQTCYVKLTIRAAFDKSNYIAITTLQNEDELASEWRVRATVHGMAGTPLGLPTETTAAPRRSAEHLRTLRIGGGCTHACLWEETIRLPIRWRDLPRDAYLQLDVLGPTDELVRGCMCVPISYRRRCLV